MAPGKLAKPGTKYGPCAEPCNHRDCKITRRMAEMLCPHCSEPIGYEQFFYDDPDLGLVHFSCMSEMVEDGSFRSAKPRG